MKARFWYYKGSDEIGNGDEEKEAHKLRVKKRKVKASQIQKKLKM